MKKNEYIEDLEYAITSIEQIHPDLMRNVTKAEYCDVVQKIRNTKDYSREGLFLNISKLCATIKDGHTCIRDNDIDKLQIKLLYIDGKIYIVNNKYNININYEEILSINEIPISEIVDRIKIYSVGQNEEEKASNIEVLLTNLSMLKGLKIVKNNCILQTTNNKIDLLNTQTCENWVLENVLNTTKWLNENTYYFKYGICGLSKESVDKLINGTIVDITKKDTRKIIIDLRGNVGGNSELIQPLIDFLKEYLKNHNIKLICIIDKKVYSSGIFAAVSLKELGAMFIGGTISGTINHFGYPKRLKLKNSKYNLSISQIEWVYLENKYIGLKSCDYINLSNKQLSKIRERKQIVPDIISHNTLNNIRNGIDEVLNTAKEV